MTVTDGQGNVIKAGGIGDILKALNNIQDMLQKAGRLLRADPEEAG